MLVYTDAAALWLNSPQPTIAHTARMHRHAPILRGSALASREGFARGSLADVRALAQARWTRYFDRAQHRSIEWHP